MAWSAGRRASDPGGIPRSVNTTGRRWLTGKASPRGQYSFLMTK